MTAECFLCSLGSRGPAVATWRRYGQIQPEARTEPLTENRKVGGSTPPLATTELQVRWPLACGFVSRVERVPFLRPTVSDRDFARIAGSYRTELRSENSCHEMSKVSLPSHGRPSTHANLRLVRDHARAVLNCRADPDLEAKWRVWS